MRGGGCITHCRDARRETWPYRANARLTKRIDQRKVNPDYDVYLITRRCYKARVYVGKIPLLSILTRKWLIDMVLYIGHTRSGGCPSSTPPRCMTFKESLGGCAGTPSVLFVCVL